MQLTNYERMLELIDVLDELDPEHGDSNVFLNFLDEYAPSDYMLDEEFDLFEFRDAHADEYVAMLEEYIATEA